MNIQKIRIKNFKSFYNETEINFNDIQGLWRVSGSIGSGKTSLGEAIIFGLYGTISGKSNKDLLAWGERHAMVELWLLSRGRNIYIRREINKHGQDPLYVEVDGEAIVFTNKRDAQQQLETEYLDASRSSMELLCIISFNNFKSLSTLNTKDTKIFLDQVLGLDILTVYADAAKEMRSDVKDNISNLDAQISANNYQIERLKSMPERVECKEEIDQLESEIPLIKENIRKAQDKLNKKLTPLQKELGDNCSRLTGIKVLGAEKKKEIDFIKKGVCPTCGAPIDQSQLELKEKERQNLLDQYSEINTHISDLNEQISNLKEKSTNYIAEKENSVKSKENELIRLREQYNRVKIDGKEIERLENAVAELQKEANIFNKEMTDLNEIIEIFQTQIRQKALESFVPSINSKIQEYAGMLSLPYVPEFDYSFKCSVRSNAQLIPTSSLSTGQLKMVDVVIILSILSSVLSKVHSNVIFLDELFSNLDPRTRADLMNVLRISFPEDSSIFVVSHQDIDTEVFDGQIRMSLQKQGDYPGTYMNIVKTKGK